MLCAIAKIDPVSTERLAKLRRMANDFGIFPRELHGHITLATYTGEDEAGFIASCKAILSGYQKFTVRYEKVEIWASVPEPQIIVAAPHREPVMADMQKEIARAWAADLNEWTQADVWKPHTTLLYAPGADLAAIAAAMQQEFAPFTAQVDRIEFSQVNGEIKTIDFAELNERRRI